MSEVQTETVDEGAGVTMVVETPVVETPKRVLKKAPAPAEEKVRVEPAPKVEPSSSSPEMREIQRTNDRTIKEMIDNLGGQGCFKIRISRKDPDEVMDPSTGKYINVGGFLKETDQAIDEEWLLRKYGGGKYELQFMKPGPKSGWVWGPLKTVTIAGEPNLAELPRSNRQHAGAGAAPANAENPSIVNKAFEFMGKQVEQAQQQAASAHRTGPDDAMVQLLREQLADSRRAQEALAREMREMREAQQKVPPKSTEDTVKDKLLERMFDGESARITALRSTYESEIRQVKDSQREDEKRLYDRFERDIASLRDASKREIDNLRVSHEVALSSVKASTEVQLASARASFDTQVSLLKAENARLLADNAKLELEVKDLRAKKEKSPIELLKEVNALKEAIGADDDEEPQGVGAQIAAAVTNPAMWDGISSMVGRVRGPDPAQQQAAQQPENGKRQRRVVKYGDKKMILEADGRTLTEIKEKKLEEGKPAEPQMPQVDPAVIANMVQLLESAFEGGQEPAIVAQGARSRVPEDLLLAIRDHGVDQVMAKMAKLSSTSPLSSQRGRVWVRALGEALVG